MAEGYHTLIEHYEQCLAKHGDSHLGVDWPNAADAETRYRVMLDVISDSPDRSVTLLDFGCGAAHLNEYIQRQAGTNIRYTGVDASASFIELSRRKFPTNSFHCVDILEEGSQLPEADYIVMNGVLTEKRGCRSTK